VGPYLITNEDIGEGANGKVKLAIHTSTGMKAAVKFVSKTASRATLEECLKEVRILQRLQQHKNIVKIQHIEESERGIFIFTDYLEERDLYSYIQRNGVFDEEKARKLFKQMVSSLEYCHVNNICHHDFKLENCVINKEMELRLIDFGYAVEFGTQRDNNNTNGLIHKYNGSPAYSAPEILFRRPHTESVDLFGLGVSLYHMLTGSFPFCDPERTTYEQLVRNVRNFCLTFPEGVSSDAQDLMKRLLAKENRITIQEIRKHPWVTYSKQDPQFLK
jgi:serine/threonine protein kinase